MSKKITYLAGGCFWGLEELFRELPGVLDTEVGYMGGGDKNPNYYDHPGHAEALSITYDNATISYSTVLDYFFRVHDPTTLNQQGNDKGSSYRSAIFYRDSDELRQAKIMIEKVNASKLYSKPVITSLEKFVKFYPAEDYHQDYLQKHPGGYSSHYLRINKSLIK